MAAGTRVTASMPTNDPTTAGCALPILKAAAGLVAVILLGIAFAFAWQLALDTVPAPYQPSSTTGCTVCMVGGVR